MTVTIPDPLHSEIDVVRGDRSGLRMTLERPPNRRPHHDAMRVTGRVRLGVRA